MIEGENLVSRVYLEVEGRRGGVHHQVEDHRHCQGLHRLLQEVQAVPDGEGEDHAHWRHPQQTDRIFFVLPAQRESACLAHLTAIFILVLKL